MTNPDAAERRGALTRQMLLAASFEMLQLEGIGALTMRALADRLGVKAASLYWHVRDRGQLLELLADSLLDTVPRPVDGGDWRTVAREAADGLHAAVAGQRDAARLLLDVPGAVEGSHVASGVRAVLETAGLGSDVAAEATAALLFHVIVHAARSVAPGAGEAATGQPATGQPATLVVENPSGGVKVRAGIGVEGLARASRSGAAAAGVSASGSEVVVRRPRGARQADVELNPLHPWSILVKGGTWKTRLVLTGLDVQGIKLDGGSTGIECVLPRPRGVVPVLVSGGVVNVDLHRPAGTAASAKISAGALRVQLDSFSTRVALLDSSWTSGDDLGIADRYELRISAGAIQVTLDERAPQGAEPAQVPPPAVGDVSVGRELLLDGIARRLAGG
jgi:AcrR family transcriptional regulator